MTLLADLFVRAGLLSTICCPLPRIHGPHSFTRMILVSHERFSCGLFRSRGSFTHNMRTSSFARGPLLLTKWTFMAELRKRIRIYLMDLYLSAQADHFMVHANVLSVLFMRAFPVSRTSRADLCSSTPKVRGPKDIPAPLRKK